MYALLRKIPGTFNKTVVAISHEEAQARLAAGEIFAHTHQLFEEHDQPQEVASDEQEYATKDMAPKRRGRPAKTESEE